MRKTTKHIILIMSVIMAACTTNESSNRTAAEILGNPSYKAISYSGYRGLSRQVQPTLQELREDILLLAAMDIKLIRMYNVYLDQASNVMKVIRSLKEENPNFEMYVMLGAWIDCKNAWTDLPPDHSQESERNAAEIERAIKLANNYPDIVKIIAVGNEAMVKWAEAYYVQADVILKHVNYLQDKKQNGQLPKDLWITSSDNFASWGGGDSIYHTTALNELIRAVDFLSVHTYPMHDTHYNPSFWGNTSDEANLSKVKRTELAMQRSLEYAKSQYESVVAYMRSIGIDKPVHIGETGWATVSNDNYGSNGSKACDEYKSALYHQYIRDWTNENAISCFYFEAFDEQWKDAKNPKGSENHFGLINLKSQAKMSVWEYVDNGAFDGLSRDGKPITKTYNGNLDSLLANVIAPPINNATFTTL